MISGIKLQRLPVVGNFIDQYFPRWLLDGLGVQFLLRWNVAADRCRRGDGHRQSDRGAVDHAALRRVYAAGRPDSRPPQRQCEDDHSEEPRRARKDAAKRVLVYEILQDLAGNGAGRSHDQDLEVEAEQMMNDAGARPALKGYYVQAAGSNIRLCFALR